MSSARWPSSRTAPISSACQDHDHAGSLRSPRRNPAYRKRRPWNLNGRWTADLGYSLDHAAVAKLWAARGPGEATADVIQHYEAHARR